MSKKASKPDPKRKTATNRQLTEMDPDIIYFTHARVRPVFTGCNKRIMETLEEIESGVTRVEDIPYITVIENFEVAPESAAEKGGKSGGGKGKGGKKGKRRGDSSDDDDGPSPPPKSKPAAAGADAQPFYFSLNNRRLYLFKTLKSRGIIDKVPVQVKPALERERVKYTRDRCVLRAKLMGAGQKPVGAQDEEGDDDGDEDAEEDEE